MIARLLDLARRRADQGDLVAKTDQTHVLRLDAEGSTALQVNRSQGVNLRLHLDGRTGSAGTTGEDPVTLLEHALAAARIGDPLGLTLARSVDPPPVVTHFPGAASASLVDLSKLGSVVVDRLRADTIGVGLTVERSIGSVRVANTRGLDASYDVSRVSLAVEATIRSARGGLRVTEYWTGADLPDYPVLEGMVARIQQRRRWAARPATAAPGRMNACFAGQALLALLLPIEQALVGKTVLNGASPLGGRRGGQPAFSPSLNLTDNPLAPGRPGSRPVDDEGTPSRSTPLVRDGVVEGFIYDLETATRAGQSPTGHGRRSTFGKPQAAYTNLELGSGNLGFEALLGQMGDGILLERLQGIPGSTLAGGTFTYPVAVGWRIRSGEVEGLLEDATVAGHAYDLLNRIGGVGADQRWLGSRALVPLAIEGVSVLAPS